MRKLNFQFSVIFSKLIKKSSISKSTQQLSHYLVFILNNFTIIASSFEHFPYLIQFIFLFELIVKSFLHQYKFLEILRFFYLLSDRIQVFIILNFKSLFSWANISHNLLKVYLWSFTRSIRLCKVNSLLFWGLSYLRLLYFFFFFIR
jgi:hypothetical protein